MSIYRFVVTRWAASQLRTGRVLPAQQDQHRQLRLAVGALALPAFLVIGFALCYDSAWQAPGPLQEVPPGT